MKTTDLCDQYSDQIRVAESIGFKNFGGRHEFHGQIETVKCYEDNSFVRATLERDGSGRVLVVDGGGSTRCALLGDNIAELAQQNKWNGIVIYGSIRDSVAVSKVEIGVLALGTNPKKSAKNNEGSMSISLHFAGVNFFPGEFVYIDEDGMILSAGDLISP